MSITQLAACVKLMEFDYLCFGITDPNFLMLYSSVYLRSVLSCRHRKSYSRSLSRSRSPVRGPVRNPPYRRTNRLNDSKSPEPGSPISSPEAPRMSETLRARLGPRVGGAQGKDADGNGAPKLKRSRSYDRRSYSGSRSPRRSPSESPSPRGRGLVSYGRMKEDRSPRQAQSPSVSPSRSSSRSPSPPPSKPGLVSYGEGSPDSRSMS